jgi:hypothetical protein
MAPAPARPRVRYTDWPVVSTMDRFTSALAGRRASLAVGAVGQTFPMGGLHLLFFLLPACLGAHSNGARCASRTVRRLRSQCFEVGRYHWPRLLNCAAGSARHTRLRGLDRRARNRAVRTEHAAIARLRPQRHPAAGASVKKPARVSRHKFRFFAWHNAGRR